MNYMKFSVLIRLPRSLYNLRNLRCFQRRKGVNVHRSDLYVLYSPGIFFHKFPSSLATDLKIVSLTVVTFRSAPSLIRTRQNHLNKFKELLLVCVQGRRIAHFL